MSQGKYTLELDIPYSRLDEFGWASNRLLRHLRTGRDLKLGNGCMFEPKTGTLLLEMKNLRPDLWYSPDTDDLRLGAGDLMTVPGKWEETPQTLATQALGDAQKWLRSGNFTLIETLTVAALASIANAILLGSRQLVPILASATPYPANQGYHIRMLAHSAPAVLEKDYLAVRFGDFMITWHTDGGAELYWSSDGSCSESSWVLKKNFGTFLDPKGMTSSVFGFTPSAILDFFIIPFGRGHIWFMVKSGGKIFSEIYTHKEATYNGTTECYEITKAGKIAIYANASGSHSLHLQISKVGYVTEGSYEDVTWKLPYAPTTAPALGTYWSKTSGTPTVATTLLTGGGAGWVSNGTNKECKVRLALAGDGSCTPWIDAYGLSFPEIITQVNPQTVTISHDKILELGIADSLRDFDGQRFEASIIDEGGDAALSAMMWRGRFTGRLKIDDEPYMEVMFEKPRTTLRRQFNVIHLNGTNLGVYRLTKKHFFFASSYGGYTHPDAMKKLLKHCGFPDARIVTDSDTVELPPAELGTESTDTKESEIKTQPEFGSSCREFALYIRDEYSANWTLRYTGDGKWYYKAFTDPATAQGTIASNETLAGIRSGAPWYAVGPELEVEPPEGNVLWLIGETADGEAIGNKAYNTNSVTSTANPKPLSYLGEWEPIVRIDRTIGDAEILNQCLQHIASEAFKGHAYITWKGPFNRNLKVGTRWRLQNIADVIIEDLDAAAGSPRALEMTESTTYVGRVCRT